MKDIQYFLDVEDKYCQTIPEEVEVWDEDVQEWDYKRIPLDFLRSRPFYQSYNNLDYRKERTQGYDLNDAELTVLGMFFMHCSAPFRDDYYTQKGDAVPEIAKRVTGGTVPRHIWGLVAWAALYPDEDYHHCESGQDEMSATTCVITACASLLMFCLVWYATMDKRTANEKSPQ